MSEEATPTSDPTPPPSPPPQPVSGPIWSQIWQLPALVAGLLVFAVGIYLVLPTPQKDQFEAVIRETNALIEGGHLDQAQENLKTILEPNVERATDLEKARYAQLWADLIYQQQRENQWNNPENHRKVLGYFQQAQELGLALDGVHQQRLAETLVALGRDEEAIAALGEAEGEAANRRYPVIRRIIERRRAAGDGIGQLVPLLARFETEVRGELDLGVRREQQVWAAGLRAKLLLEAEEPGEAIHYLQRRLAQIMADQSSEEGLAPLWVMLAEGYQKQAEYGEARRWYQRAQQGLESSDGLQAEVLVGLGDLELAERGDVRAALEYFSAAETEYPTAGAYFEALVSRADCEAQLEGHGEAIERFAKAVKLVREGGGGAGEKAGRLGKALRSQYDVNTTREAYELALDYLGLLVELNRPELPADLELELARGHQRLAKATLQEARAKAGMDRSGAGAGLDELSGGETAGERSAFQEAAVHFEEAGDHYFHHAHATTEDDLKYSTSLWEAAVCYDAAQAWGKAIRVYSEFRLRKDDPRHLEAAYRLGIAFLSDGQHQAAKELFEQLQDEHGRSPEAYKSLVPLAQSQLALNEVDDAQRLLEQVVSDHPAITPESVEYRRALIELGKILYRQGQYELGIERLAEAVERYGDSREGPVLKYWLADTYRLSAEQLGGELADPMTRSRQAALEKERAARLGKAQELFGQVVAALDVKGGKKMSAVERVCLRNAYIYRADCAYDQGKYAEAIDLFDFAARRLDEDPASLVALVQIVNAYCQMGRLQEAKAANDRARWRLKRIPDEAFNDPSLPMTRAHWEEWLRWTDELNLFDSQAKAEQGAASDGP